MSYKKLKQKLFISPRSQVTLATEITIEYANVLSIIGIC